jgi:hypothetical protein
MVHLSLAVTIYRNASIIDCSVGHFLYYGYIGILPLAFKYSTIIFSNSYAHDLKLFADFYISAILQYKVCLLRLSDVISEQQKYIICIYVLVHIGMWMYNGVAVLLAQIRLTDSFYSILLNFSHTSKACCVEYRMSIQNVPQGSQLYSL